MGSRAKKKSALRQHAIIEDIKRLQPAAELERARMEQAEAELKRSQSGGITGMLSRREEAFRRKKTVTDQVMKIIEQNGITAKDLDEAWTRGREEGFRMAAENIVKCCYAGIVLALHDEFGFGESRCFRALKAVDERTIYALNHYEMVDEVLEKTGLKLELDDPLERVQRTR